MKTRTFGQTTKDIKNLLLCNRIMLAQDDEQKESYDSYSEKRLKEEFKFPILNEDIKTVLISAWVKWVKESKNEIAKEIFEETTFVEPFDFFKKTAQLLILMEVSYESLLKSEQENQNQLSKQGMLNFCKRALALYKNIILIQEYLDFAKDSLKSAIIANPNLKIPAEEYVEFREKEKIIYESIKPQLEELGKMIVKEAVDTERFLLWFRQNSVSDIKLIQENSDQSGSANYSLNNRTK